MKGRAGGAPLGSIAVTAGEFEDSRRQHPDTALFVLHSIKLDGSPTKPRAREGEVT